jgi:exopolysaccharide/PEP-CTERM locus tyrosine autokinase
MVKIADALEKAGITEDEVNGPAEEEQAVSASPEDREDALPSQHEALDSHTPSSEPRRNRAWDERLFRSVNDEPYFPEVFKVLRSRILHPRDDRPIPRTIMITSAAPKEGKSFVSANLGISLAQGLDQYCLLVDCDLRRPSLASMFGLAAYPGLVDYLRDHVELNRLINRTSVSKLSVLASGKPPVNPAELLGSARMRRLVDELCKRYDDRFIIFDSPPVQVASESVVLAGQVDAVILVVRQGGAGKSLIKRLIDTIGPERLLGVVFNAQQTNIIERSLMPGYGNYYYSE